MQITPTPSPEIDRLIAKVHRVAKRLKLSVARVSDLALGSGREVERITSGGDVGARKIRRALATLADLEHPNRNRPGRAPNDPPPRRRRESQSRAK